MRFKNRKCLENCHSCSDREYLHMPYNALRRITQEMTQAFKWLVDIEKQVFSSFIFMTSMSGNIAIQPPTTMSENVFTFLLVCFLVLCDKHV